MGSAKIKMVGCALSLSACVGEPEAFEDAAQDEEVAHTEAALRYQPQVSIDPRRSLAITDQPILARFPFERVMNQLVDQAKVRGLDATKLFQQWWDTQNPQAEGRFDGPHCDDEVDAELGPVINGFPYGCRPAPAEGAQATCNPFKDAACAYIPVGLFSRFDLASEDGASCGEFRIVYAKQSGQTNNRDRNTIIFEAALPNPSPSEGLRGCRSIVSFWAELSGIDDVKKRAKLLERFYFKGLGRDIAPAIHINHFGNNPDNLGQVRTNQFVQDGLEQRSWSLREFKLEYECTDDRGDVKCGHGRKHTKHAKHGKHGKRSKQECTLTFVPVTNKVNPYGPLFAEEPTHPKQAAFQQLFVSQVQALAADEVTSIAMQIDDAFNSAQSQASGGIETDYLAWFADDGELAADIQEELDRIGSDLEPIDIIARAQTQSCAGCHRFSNNRDLGAGLTWPTSLGFTHVDERTLEEVDGVLRYPISDALTSTFLPARKRVMEDFLRGSPRKVRDYAELGGHGRH
jgi:hypothetical protein